MNEKEIGELRRRLKPDRTAVTHVRGCYVNEAREIVSQFDQSLAMMTPEENEKLLGVLRKTLSGTLGKNLTDITFETQQVVSGEEHKLLMALRDSKLQDEEAIQTLFQTAIRSVDLEGSYLILLAYDAYDVPYRSKDGAQQDDASEEVFTYLLCSVCPVKQTKPALSYLVHENAFHNLSPDWVVSAPELGFLFPAFDDRSTNLYNALYYCRNVEQNHQDFIDAMFKVPAPMAPAVQKETFQSVLGEALGEECSMEVVQAVHAELSGLIEEHKASKVPEPLVISKRTVSGVLHSCGVDDEHLEAFSQSYEESFGGDVDLSPKNLVEPGQIQVSTPDVTIRISGERGDLIETRIIDGRKYILIRADEGVEVNGVPIHITE